MGLCGARRAAGSTVRSCKRGRRSAALAESLTPCARVSPRAGAHGRTRLTERPAAWMEYSTALRARSRPGHGHTRGGATGIARRPRAPLPKAPCRTGDRVLLGFGKDSSGSGDSLGPEEPGQGAGRRPRPARAGLTPQSRNRRGAQGACPRRSRPRPPASWSLSAEQRRPPAPAAGPGPPRFCPRSNRGPCPRAGRGAVGRPCRPGGGARPVRLAHSFLGATQASPPRCQPPHVPTELLETSAPCVLASASWRRPLCGSHPIPEPLR